MLTKLTVPVLIVNGELPKNEVLNQFLNAVNAILCSLGRPHAAFNRQMLTYLNPAHTLTFANNDPNTAGHDHGQAPTTADILNLPPMPHN